MEKNIIVCIPSDVDVLPDKKYIPGPNYIKVPCESCQQNMWAGEKQREMKAANPDVPMICVLCLKKHAIQAKQGEIKMLNPNAGSKFEER
jgi:hypothetical protein